MIYLLVTQFFLKGMVCGYVADSVISVAIYDIFILDGIGGVWYVTWLVL